MEAIKKIAGDLLLFFYASQRDSTSIGKIMLSFGIETNEKKELEKSEIGKKILEISKESLIDTYNAIQYLKEKKFIDIKEGQFTDYDNGNVTYNFYDLRVSAYGIDIIEGIERGAQEKKDFQINFNIKLTDNLNIESLIKTEIGSLFRASII